MPGKQLFLAFLLLCLLLTNSLTSNAQQQKTLNYQITVMGMNIGNLTVIQKENGDTIQTKIITRVKVKIIFTYKIDYFQTSRFIQGHLDESHLKTIKNGKLNSETWFLRKTNDRYLFIDKQDTSLIHSEIFYSGSLLYTREPTKLSSYFKENSGERVFIRSDLPHNYVVSNAKGKELNQYHYKNGSLDKIIINYPVATIRLKRIKVNNDE